MHNKNGKKMPELLSESRVLIVDDESTNINILGDALSDDYVVVAANCGEEALRIAREDKKPDLILLDVKMPDMSGFDVCKQLKENDDTAEISIIFVTSLDDQFNEEAGFEVGACDYIQKPFSPSIVKARVKVHLENMRYRKVLEVLLKISADEIKKLSDNKTMPS
jgi:PleD family two-component response regulator